MKEVPCARIPFEASFKVRVEFHSLSLFVGVPTGFICFAKVESPES